MEALTPKQKDVFNYIKKQIDSEGIPPTLDEIALHFEYKSINTVRGHLRLISNKGYIKVLPNKSRGIQILKSNDTIISDQLFCDDKIPILGKIAAGVPIFANQETEDHLKLPVGFLSTGNHFALQISGDSMKDIGINTGDIAIIRHQNMVENGEVAAVILEDEATLKRFFKYPDRIVLKSENSKFSDISVSIDEYLNVRIVGKLVGLITRKIAA